MAEKQLKRGEIVRISLRENALRFGFKGSGFEPRWQSLCFVLGQDS